MDNQLELITYEKIRHVKIFVNNITYRTFHTHNAFELLCMLSGKSAVVTVQGEKIEMQKGDITLINPHQVHDIFAKDNNGAQFLIVQISRHFMQEYLPQLRITVFYENFISAIMTRKTRSELWAALLALSDEYFETGKSNTLFILWKVLEVLNIVASNVNAQYFSEQQYLEHKNTVSRITRITEYIDKNYQFRISLDDIAESEQITANYVSQFFTKYIGVPFQKYLNNVRLEAALRLLQDKSLSLTQVADYAGFSDAKYMTEIFRQSFNCTPRDYRKNNTSTMPAIGKGDHNTEFIYNNTQSKDILEREMPSLLS